MDSSEEAVPVKQYSIPKVIAIWAAASLPMGLLGWVVAPALSQSFNNQGFARIAILTIGLIWQFCLVIILVRKEARTFKWRVIGELLWLKKPSSPASHKNSSWLWLWIVPLIAITAIYEIGASGYIDKLWLSGLPFLAEPTNFSLGSYLGSPTGKAEMVGAWGTLLLFILNALFNTFLGEELLFRGLLLPRMQGKFGKWAWIANGVLFGLYHIHQPWGILSAIVSGTLLFALPTKLFKSSWFGIVLHSGQSVFFAFIMLGMVLGLS